MNVINGGKVTVTLVDYDLGEMEGRVALILECDVFRTKCLGTVRLGIVYNDSQELVKTIKVLRGTNAYYGLKAMIGTNYEAVYRATTPGHGILTFCGMGLAIEGEINDMLKN